MKVALVVVGIVLLLAVGVQIFAMRGRSNIESYPYELIEEYDQFEIRRYEASLFTSVKIATNNYSQASSNGFSALAGYIFGGNDKQEKIAMTSPVAMTLEDTMTMMFMVPKEYAKEDLPTPNQEGIEFVEMPPKVVAAIRFSGWANDAKIEKYKKKLVKALKRNGIAHSNHFQFLGYNPPYDMVDRRNEVIVELTNY